MSLKLEAETLVAKMEIKFGTVAKNKRHKNSSNESPIL